MTQPFEPSERDLLIEIKTKLDGVLSRDEDKENRIRSLERFRAMATGGGVVLGMLSSSGLITALVTR